MTERSLTHSSINLERAYDAAPETVFNAWASVDALRQWAVPGDGFDVDYRAFDFRPGGAEISIFSLPDGTRLENEGTFGDIVANERFTSLYTMSQGDTRIFSGLLSVEFHPAPDGCLLKMTEQGVFYDGHDKPENHQMGYRSMLEALTDFLAS